MKLLVFLADAFHYEACQQGSPQAVAAHGATGKHARCLVAFVHMEPDDEARHQGLLKQAVKYFRWFARKRACEEVVLHSFAHLAEERASAAFAKQFLDELDDRLKLAGLRCEQTPFGWSLQWSLSVDGGAYAKTFKSL